MKQVFFFLFLLIGLVSVRGQTGELNEKMAVTFLESGDYEKANEYLSDLFSQSPNYWYENYYFSLVKVKDYSKAEKITRKILKLERNGAYLYVKLGNLYELQNDEKKAKEYFEKAIKELQPVSFSIERTATEFKKLAKYDFAIATFNKGAKLLEDYRFFYERAEVYKLQNDLPNMIREYLDALEFRDSELMNVQANLQNSLGYDDATGGFNNPILRQELQKRIQKNPDKKVLAEFLIYILEQQRDFESAFIQAKALDKRFSEDGSRIMHLAQIIKANKQWELATRCFKYVIDKGQSSPYELKAGLEILDVEFLALTLQANPDKKIMLDLEKKLEQGLITYNKLSENVLITKNLANLRAYYLDKTEAAIELLQTSIATPAITPMLQAEYKLMLGDVYLLTGEIWEASLLYSQVEKTFKFEAIGNEAKFRNAKLSYYAGDFSWAKAQADVLKGATSKLIANDALDLSLIIGDAIGVDTNEAPLKLFSSAELLALRHQYDQAILCMDSINQLFSSHTLGDDIFYKKAQIYESQGNWTEAENMYKSIIDFYATEIYGDDAMFKLAELYEYRIKDIDRAKKTYEDLLLKFPGSVYAVESRKRFRQLRGDNLSN